MLHDYFKLPKNLIRILGVGFQSLKISSSKKIIKIWILRKIGKSLSLQRILDHHVLHNCVKCEKDLAGCFGGVAIRSKSWQMMRTMMTLSPSSDKLRLPKGRADLIKPLWWISSLVMHTWAIGTGIATVRWRTNLPVQIAGQVCSELLAKSRQGHVYLRKYGTFCKCFCIWYNKFHGTICD